MNVGDKEISVEILKTGNTCIGHDHKHSYMPIVKIILSDKNGCLPESKEDAQKLIDRFLAFVERGS